MYDRNYYILLLCTRCVLSIAIDREDTP